MFNMFHVNVGLDKDSCLEGEHSVEDLERRVWRRGGGVGSLSLCTKPSGSRGCRYICLGLYIAHSTQNGRLQRFEAT